MSECYVSIPDLIASTQSETFSDVEAIVVNLRTSATHSKPQLWVDSYVTICAKNSCLYPISQYVSYSNLTPTYRASLAAYCTISKHYAYVEASQDPNGVNVMNFDITALEDNNTSFVVPLHSIKVPIGCKWVFKVKRKASGEAERYKAMLVANGYISKKVLIILKLCHH